MTHPHQPAPAVALAVAATVAAALAVAVAPWVVIPEGNLLFAVALALLRKPHSPRREQTRAHALASEVGQGVSLGIPTMQEEGGFSPWGMLSCRARWCRVRQLWPPSRTKARRTLPSRPAPRVISEVNLRFFRRLALALLLPTLAQATCTPPPTFTQLKSPTANDYGTLGNLYQQQQNAPCALEAFRHGLSLDPQSAPLHYSLGITLYVTGKKQAAAEAMQQALQIKPNLAQAHLALGVLDHESGHRAEALTHWQQALLLDPTLLIAIDWIAKAQIEQAQYDAAAALLRSSPADEELLLDLIVADSKAGLPDEAITRAQQALIAHPEWTRVSPALATVLVQRNRYEEAAAILQKARQQDPTLDLLYLRVLALKADTAAALPLARNLLAKHPGDFDLLYLTGLLERQSAEYPAAAQHLEAAAALNPTHYDTRYNLGFSLNKLHRPEEARTQLEKAIVLDPNAPEAHFQLAAALRALDQPEQARKELAQYQQQMATRAQHDRAIALTAEAIQKLETDAPTAITLYRQVIAEAPQDPQAFFHLAIALDRTGDLPAEQSALDQILKLRPTDAPAMNQLGLLASRQGNNPAAESWFRKAITAAPQFAEAQNNLGTLLASTNREPEALTHLRAALTANPRFLDAWINLAATLAGTNHFAEARSAAQNALRIAPQNPDATQLLQSLPPESTNP